MQIAVIGDSFTHGACVPSDKNFTALLRAHYPKTINLGIGGAGPLIELGTLKEYVPPLRPKVVLWVYYEGNDLEDLATRTNSFYQRYLTGGAVQELLTKQAVIDHGLIEGVHREREEIEHRTEWDHTSERIFQFLRLKTLRTQINRRFFGRIFTASPETFALFRSTIAEAKRETESWGGTLVFVYLPQYHRYLSPDLASPDRGRVLDLAQELNLKVIDLHPVFLAEKDPTGLFPFHRFGHYTIMGNVLVAETIVKNLDDLMRESAPSRLNESMQ